MNNSRTKGSRAFAALISSGQFTQAQLAEFLSVSQQTVSKWVSGQSRPEDLVVLLRIQAAFRIRVTDWLTDDERDAVRATKKPDGGRQRAPRATLAA